jgi:hypothetical protein
MAVMSFVEEKLSARNVPCESTEEEQVSYAAGTGEDELAFPLVDAEAVATHWRELLLYLRFGFP